MDSSDDGNRGYDIPDDDGGGGGNGLGFRTTGNDPSRPIGENSDRSDRSSDDDRVDDDSDDDGGDDNFAYGAYGRRKRGERGRRSKVTDKERALYGVFCESSDDGGGGGGKRGKRGRGEQKRARHFDKRQNKTAALAFVRAAADGGGDKAASDETKSKRAEEEKEAEEAKEAKEAKEAEAPGWLMEKSRVGLSQGGSNKVKLKHKSGDAKPDAGEDAAAKAADAAADAADAAAAEEDAKFANERGDRFEELLAVATTSTNPLLPSAGAETQRPPAAPAADVGAGARPSSSASPGIGFAGVASVDAGGEPSIPETSRGGVGTGAAARTSESEDDPPGIGATRPRGHVHRPGTGGASGFVGFGSNGNNEGFPPFSRGSTGFGLGLGNHAQGTKKKVNNPNLGKWEKHTKGIGMKLLQKMGYKGSGGLGADRRKRGGDAPGPAATDGNGREIKREDGSTKKKAAQATSDEEGPTAKTGISRPVEVVVRPNGLGLGFGNFKEQSQLKVNRQIEAEVRGLKLKPPEDETSKKKREMGKGGLFDGIDKSLLPTTESLLHRGASSWRGGKTNGRRKKRKVVNYQDILDRRSAAEDGGPGKTKIVDMRGPASATGREPTAPSSTTSAVLLGEELLHNVTLLLNAHEGKLHVSSHMAKNAKRKAAGLEAEREETARRREGVRDRERKTKLALDVVERAERLCETLSSMSKEEDGDDMLDFAMESLRSILASVYDNFSREERTALKFDWTLLPSIVTPVLDSLMSATTSLEMGGPSWRCWMDRLAAGIRGLCGAAAGSSSSSPSDDSEAYALRELIFVRGVVPWISDSLRSSKWDPVADVEAGLGAYEGLLDCALQSLPGAESGENDILKESIREEVVQKAVLPRLSRALSRWRPALSDDGEGRRKSIVDALHLWLLPWLPHVRDGSARGTLLGDARRSLRKALSLLGGSVPADAAFARSCIPVLLPWRGPLGESTVHGLTSDSIAPRLARSLARARVDVRPAGQNWEHLHGLFECFEAGLMSSDDFLSLIEGEVLPAWANALHSALREKDHDPNDIKGFYTAWKGQFFGPSTATCGGTPNPQSTLRSDPTACRYFYGGLKMIQAAADSDGASLESLRPPRPSDCNYRISLMRRSKEREPRGGEEPGAANDGARRKTHGNNNGMASFQEVVESFANRRDITFHPKTGSNSTKDGKPVFKFGDRLVYFEKNVLFACQGSAWRPVSLEHLAKAC